MDNFILYDEICKTEYSIIFKGRRKGTINYVAIHRIDKSLRPEISNLVRITHDLTHHNAVKFYEWYETANHLWLVVELCTAGTLELLLEQDGNLPESSICEFGIDICEGLFYIHSLGYLFCDLVPRKIMIDGNGTLKLSDFGLAKAEGEDLEQIFLETYENTSAQWSQSVTQPPKVYKKPFGDVRYLAPEVLEDEENSCASDLWSLGCILYKMYAGSTPFIGDTVEQIQHAICTRDLAFPKGNKLSTKPSTDFWVLLKGLLEKDPTKRFTWRKVISSPFWEKRLQHLMPLVTKSIIVDGKEQIVEVEQESDDEIAETRRGNLSRISTSDRPRTAGASAAFLDQKPEMNVSFSISSRLPISPQSTIQTRNPVQYKESEEQSSISTLVSQHITPQEELVAKRATEAFHEHRRLFFVPSELHVMQIVDNPTIQKPGLLKFEPKSLPFTDVKFLKAESLLKLNTSDFDRWLELVKANLNVSTDKSTNAIKLKLHLMNYVGSVCCESSRCADGFIRVELQRDLLSVIKNGPNIEMKMKAARVLAILFNKTRKIDTTKELTDVMQGLLDVISTNRKDFKFKQMLLPALGEIMYAVSMQEGDKTSESWCVPAQTYVMLVRSVGDDLTVNHIVCKIIENVATTHSVNAQKFFAYQSDVVNALWSCFSHAGNNEQLRVTSINALCMLSSHQISAFVTLIDKIGVDLMLECLSPNTNSLIQQPMLTMLTMLAHENDLLKSVPDRKLVAKLAPLYESSSVLCRAKAYMLTHAVLHANHDLLTTFASTKLISSLERDHRKTFAVAEEHTFMRRHIDALHTLLTSIAASIFEELVGALETVAGRRSPTATQSKQLKHAIPLANNLKVLIASATFRTKIIDAPFIESFSKLLRCAKSLTNGAPDSLNLDATCGVGATSAFLDVLISLLECFLQHKESVAQYAPALMDHVLPALMDNLNNSDTSGSVDLKVVSAKVLSECATLFFNTHSGISMNDDLRKRLRDLVEKQFVDTLVHLLSEPEPLPFFAIVVVQTTLKYDITLVSLLKVRNVLPAFFKLLQNYKTRIGSAHTVKLLNILTLWSSTIDPSDLYENGIVDNVKSMILGLLEISKAKRLDDRVLIETLIELLKIVDNLLKYIRHDYVKKALQAKKAAIPNDSIEIQTEKMLRINRPLVATSQFLITLLIHEDTDLNELACNVLYNIIQLFGCECKDLVSQENVSIVSSAISNSKPSIQVVLLKMVKRTITSDAKNMEAFKALGQKFIEQLRILMKSANSEANVNLSNVISEILKLSA